jgi:hypothetical protein
VLGWPLGERPGPDAPRKDVPPSVQIVMDLIQRVDREEPVNRLEEALRGDPTLAFRLMRLINSPAFGLSVEISSFQHAIMVLGYQRLKRWLALLVTNAVDNPDLQPLMQLAVRRGLLMEELVRAQGDSGAAGEAFICGVFSLLDRMLGQPFERLLGNLPVGEGVAQTLAPSGQGPYSAALAVARGGIRAAAGHRRGGRGHAAEPGRAQPGGPQGHAVGPAAAGRLRPRQARQGGEGTATLGAPPSCPAMSIKSKLLPAARVPGDAPTKVAWPCLRHWPTASPSVRCPCCSVTRRGGCCWPTSPARRAGRPAGRPRRPAAGAGRADRLAGPDAGPRRIAPARGLGGDGRAALRHWRVTSAGWPAGRGAGWCSSRTWRWKTPASWPTSRSAP